MAGCFYVTISANTESHTLSLHDALPIYAAKKAGDTLGGVIEVLAFGLPPGLGSFTHWDRRLDARLDRKSTRLNSSHVEISYAVFCLKKKICHYFPRRCSESE